jgi:hypothetical protein
MAAFMRQARHDQQLCRFHNRSVKETSFNVGDLVLKCIQKTDCMHKLSAPRKDPPSSLKSSTHPHITSNGATGKVYPTLGTWSIYDDSTHRIIFITAMYSLSLYFFSSININ